MAKADGIAATPEQMEQAVEHVFGQPPRDLLCTMEIAATAFEWLAITFKKIKEAAGTEPDIHTIRTLADMGQYLSEDRGNYIDCEREQMGMKAKEAGVRHD